MEKISDFFKEFKNRITNPLIFSFIVSWIIINWKVVVGFLMYNSNNLSQLSYNNYYDLIDANFSTSNYLQKPLLYAIAYTFLFPPIRLGIIAFLTLFKKWSNNLSLWIMKDANLPMSRLIKETESTNKLAKELEDLIKKDSATKRENEKLEVEKIKLEKTLSEKEGEILSIQGVLAKANDQINLFQQMDSTAILSGFWELKTVSRAVADPFLLDNAETALGQQVTVLLSFYNQKIQILDEDKTPHDYGLILGFAFNHISRILQITFKHKQIDIKTHKPHDDNYILTYQFLTVVLNDEGRVIAMKGSDEKDNTHTYNRNDNIKVQTIAVSA